MLAKKVWFVSALSILAGLFLVATPSLHPALAQGDPYHLGNLSIGLFNSSSPNGLFGALTSVLNFLLFIAGLLAFFYVIYGGFVYLTSGGDPAKASTGTKMITNAIVGIIIIFLSLALVRFVANRTVQESRLPSVSVLV